LRSELFHRQRDPLSHLAHAKPPNVEAEILSRNRDQQDMK